MVAFLAKAKKTKKKKGKQKKKREETKTPPEIYPADAHDAPLLPRQMHALTRAAGFATPGV